MAAPVTTIHKDIPESHRECKALPQYEVHVTVENDVWRENQLRKFKDVCEYLDIKPLYIENYIMRDGRPGFKPDILSSSVIECYRYPTAYRYMLDIDLELRLAGFNVIRRKIECSPKNPRVAMVDTNIGPNVARYFEAHIKIKDIGSAWESRLPISRNNKQMFDPNAVNTEMVTYRRFAVNYEGFMDELNHKLDKLNYDMGPGGIETEFCLYDDNVDHDNDWTKQPYLT